MQKPELSKEQQQELDEMMQMGEAFELLVRNKGWEYLKAEYSARIQRFVNGLLMKDDLPIEQFESERRELIGIRKMLGFVQDRLDKYEDESSK